MARPSQTTPRAVSASRPTPAVRRASRRLDVLLELLERRDCSPTELRILLAVGHREAHLGELSARLEKPKTTVRRGAWRLYLDGMLRQHHDSETNEPVFAITTRGVAALKPLITATHLRVEAR
jgi:DNA-binding MarR family transcriptional regulator